MKMQAKVHELSIARKIEKEMSLVGWLKTVTHPPLLWLPKLHTEDTQLLLEQRATDLYAWKVRAQNGLKHRASVSIHGARAASVSLRPVYSGSLVVGRGVCFPGHPLCVTLWLFVMSTEFLLLACFENSDASRLQPRLLRQQKL